MSLMLREPTCYGVDPEGDAAGDAHEPTTMEPLENAAGSVQYVCPVCGVLIE